MVVDIGGRITAENEAIVAGATHAIVLAGDEDAMPEWEEFFAAQGIETAALLHSDYEGKADTALERTAGALRGSVHYLERGEPSEERPTVVAVAELLGQLVAENVEYLPHIEESPLVTSVPELLGQLPGVTVTRTRGDGESYQVRTIERRELGHLYELVSSSVGQGPDGPAPVMLDGAMTGWEAIALVSSHVAAGCDEVSVRGPDGFVPVKELPAEGEGNDVVRWSVHEVLDEQVLDAAGPTWVVHADVAASTRLLNPEELPEIVIPEVPHGCTVVLSTAGPHWFRASVAQGYIQNSEVAAVASFVPGEGSTVAWARDRAQLGTVLDVGASPEMAVR